MMPRQLKVTASMTCVLAIVFYLFFQVSKQYPALAQVNAFAEDPYDAVGSFGVQVALFTALLSMLRAFRPYHLKTGIDHQRWLLVGAASLSCVAVAVTLVADGVAMFRFPSLWIGFPAGYVLVVLLGVMALFTGLVAWHIFYSARLIRLPFAHGGWTRLLGISLVGVLILALYPVGWRQSLPGAILTVFVGIFLLFVPLWTVSMAISPSQATPFEDSFDDLLAVYRWLKVHSGPFVVFFNRVEQVLSWSSVRSLLQWLNPREHRWHLPIVLGILIGCGFVLAEMLNEAAPAQFSRLALVVTLFVSLEVAGVVLGYALLAEPLGLFHQDEQG